MEKGKKEKQKKYYMNFNYKDGLGVLLRQHHYWIGSPYWSIFWNIIYLFIYFINDYLSNYSNQIIYIFGLFPFIFAVICDVPRDAQWNEVHRKMSPQEVDGRIWLTRLTRQRPLRVFL